MGGGNYFAACRNDSYFVLTPFYILRLLLCPPLIRGGQAFFLFVRGCLVYSGHYGRLTFNLLSSYSFFVCKLYKPM
jgi:hypothetical protein